MASHSLDTCLKSSKELARLLPHAGRLARLQQIYERKAPPGLARYARVTDLKSGMVHIHAENGAVATKLKQLAPSLAGEFCKSGLEVTGVSVRVQVAPHHGSPAARRAGREPMGNEPKRALAELAARLPEGSPLRGALQRLLRRSA